MDKVPEEIKISIDLNPELEGILNHLETVELGYKKAMEILKNAEEEFRGDDQKKHPDYTEQFFQKNWELINIGLNNFMLSIYQSRFQVQIKVLTLQHRIAELENNQILADKLIEHTNRVKEDYKKFSESQSFFD